eukprot:489902_1
MILIVRHINEIVNINNNQSYQTFLAWIKDVKSVFNRLEKAMNAINKELEFACNDKLGYLTACGERAKNKDLFNNIAKRNNLQIRGVKGEHSESKGGIYDVSNKQRLGITEWDHDGIKDLIRNEITRRK